MTEAHQIGTGGGLRYATVLAAPDMLNQEGTHTCQVACARQLLRDAGVEVSEEGLARRIGVIEGYGTSAESTAQALTDLHPGFHYQGGAISPDSIRILFTKGPWIASLRTDRGTIHAVIVDRLEGETVHVRDPWGLGGPQSGQGARATLRLTDFLEHWHWAINNAVFPANPK